eukprot:5658889-Amphidinium_carterae.1
MTSPGQELEKDAFADLFPFARLQCLVLKPNKGQGWKLQRGVTTRHWTKAQEQMRSSHLWVVGLFCVIRGVTLGDGFMTTSFHDLDVLHELSV